jgi:hypothetical protein
MKSIQIHMETRESKSLSEDCTSYICRSLRTGLPRRRFLLVRRAVIDSDLRLWANIRNSKSKWGSANRNELDEEVYGSVTYLRVAIIFVAMKSLEQNFWVCVWEREGVEMRWSVRNWIYGREFGPRVDEVRWGCRFGLLWRDSLFGLSYCNLYLFDGRPPWSCHVSFQQYLDRELVSHSWWFF